MSPTPAGIPARVFSATYGSRKRPWCTDFRRCLHCHKKCGDDFKLEIEAEISGLTKTDSDAEVSGMTKAGNGAEASGIAKADSDAEAALQEQETAAARLPTWTAKVVLSQCKMIVKTFALTWNAEKQLLMGEAMIENPALWDAEHPVLYHVSVALENGDKAEYNIGFRDFVFDPEQGFVANGKRVKLHGVCEHHDLGCLGAAFHKKPWRVRLQL